MARHFPRRASTRLAAVVCVATSLVFALLIAPSASFGDRDHNLRHRRDHVKHQIQNHAATYDDISNSLLRASAKVQQGQRNLTIARNRLNEVRREVAVAQRYDTLMQQRLDAAVVKLQNARQDLVDGRRALVAQRRDVVSAAIDAFQNGSTIGLSVGAAFENGSLHQTMDGIQAAQTVLDKQDLQLQQLQAKKVLLTLIRERVRAAKVEVAQTRRKAAENLARKKVLEKQATQAEINVQTRLNGLRLDQQQLTSAKRVEAAKITTLRNERQSLSRKLKALARQRAREHARQLAQQRARERAQQRQRAKQRANHHTSTSSPPASLTAPASSGAYLSFPANGPITSPYGMRLHPILHIWELHDGTDFGIPCGTPVYAAAGGRVLSTYFNAAYGNRVIIDHGWVRGVSLQTSYNHLTSFAVHPGQQVARGQLVAYSGTTGWSTGCHLHFMVYVNGSTVDPMTWL